MNCGTIQVCVEGRRARIKVIGSATFVCSEQVQEYCVQALEAGATLCRFELAACQSVDSTFIGGMTLLAMPENGRGGTVEILNASEKVQRQITSLGIGKLFTFIQQPESPGDWHNLEATVLVNVARDRVSNTMIEAHEVLGRANPENIDRFKGVLDALKRERTNKPSDPRP